MDSFINGIELSNGFNMPLIGLGMWQVEEGPLMDAAVRAALDAGYRHFDTAQAYYNEHLVGESLAKYGKRQDYFLTTKLSNRNQVSVEKAFEESLEKLQTDYVDLFLMHWPSPWRGTYVDAWKCMVRLLNDGRAKSIGVSNFKRNHLENIIQATGVVPMVNQVERHPLYQQNKLSAYCREKGIVMEAYSPLATGHMEEFAPDVTPVAKKHGKSVAQIVLRWHLQTGWAAIPKSVNPGRIAENIDVFDFALDDDDMRLLASLDAGKRFLPDADEATF